MPSLLLCPYRRRLFFQPVSCWWVGCMCCIKCVCSNCFRSLCLVRKGLVVPAAGAVLTLQGKQLAEHRALKTKLEVRCVWCAMSTFLMLCAPQTCLLDFLLYSICFDCVEYFLAKKCMHMIVAWLWGFGATSHHAIYAQTVKRIIATISQYSHASRQHSRLFVLTIVMRWGI